MKAYVDAVGAHRSAFGAATSEERALMAAASRMSTVGLQRWAGRPDRLAAITEPEAAWREARDAFRTSLVRLCCDASVVVPDDAGDDVRAFLGAASAFGRVHRDLVDRFGAEGARRLRIARDAELPAAAARAERERRRLRRAVLRAADALVEAGVVLEPSWFS